MTAEQLLEQERAISFNTFSHADACHLGMTIARIAEDEIGQSVRIRVVLGGDVVFQYLMEGKQGDEWLQKKQNTVARTGHSSLWTRMRNEETHEYDHLPDEGCVLGGGGVPILQNGESIGIVCVSGLTHTEDHDLAVMGLQQLKEGKE